MFIDAAGVSATFLMTAPIANDLGVKMGDLAWILGTYSYVPQPSSLALKLLRLTYTFVAWHSLPPSYSQVVSPISTHLTVFIHLDSSV